VITADINTKLNNNNVIFGKCLTHIFLCFNTISHPHFVLNTNDLENKRYFKQCFNYVCLMKFRGSKTTLDF